jgi:hypothetical protein
LELRQAEKSVDSALLPSQALIIISVIQFSRQDAPGEKTGGLLFPARNSSRPLSEITIMAPNNYETNQTIYQG